MPLQNIQHEINEEPPVCLQTSLSSTPNNLHPTSLHHYYISKSSSSKEKHEIHKHLAYDYRSLEPNKNSSSRELLKALNSQHKSQNESFKTFELPLENHGKAPRLHYGKSFSKRESFVPSTPGTERKRSAEKSADTWGRLIKPPLLKGRSMQNIEQFFLKEPSEKHLAKEMSSKEQCKSGMKLRPRSTYREEPNKRNSDDRR